MSIKWGPDFTFSLPEGGSPPCPPVSYATEYMGLVIIVKELTLL